MSPLRPIGLIRLELETALRYQEAYLEREPVDPLAAEMREDNEAEIGELRAELASALSGDLEISLTGAPVEGHNVQLSYFNRVTESVQAAYRAAFRARTRDGRLRRGEAALAITATAPGSFKVGLKAAPVQLELLDDPIVDRSMKVIIDLFQLAAEGPLSDATQTWASSATEAEVRAMIRAASTIASSKGMTRLRWRSAGGEERIVDVSAPAARDLAVALAGQMGREVLTVAGHLQMGQDEPPRARITTRDNVYLAKIPTTDMLDEVKALLFGDVQATMLIELRTSPTSGSPSIVTELMEVQPASEQDVED